jgi:hypothetical protein
MNRRIKKKIMRPELHKLFLELDNNDFYTENYFDWTEIQKGHLTKDIMRFFLPLIEENDIRLEYLLDGILTGIKDAEYYEDYEQAEILNRCYKEILEKIEL